MFFSLAYENWESSQGMLITKVNSGRIYAYQILISYAYSSLDTILF